MFDKLFCDCSELALRGSSAAMVPWHPEVPICISVGAVGHGDSLLSLFPGLFGFFSRHGLALALLALAFVFALALLWARK